MSHKLIDYNTFKSSLYIRTMEELLANTDFVDKKGKLLSDRYDFIYYTLRTLIELNNCFYSDSNLSFDDKKDKAIGIIEKYAFNSSGDNYSVRFVRDRVPDQYCINLYDKIYGYENKDSKYDSWYSIISKAQDKSDIITTLNEIRNELSLLDSVAFDSLYKADTLFLPNDNRLYLCSFSRLCPNYAKNIDNFIKAHDYLPMLKQDDFDETINLFILVAKAYNGISVLLNKKTSDDYQMSHTLENVVKYAKKGYHNKNINGLLRQYPQLNNIEFNTEYDELKKISSIPIMFNSLKCDEPNEFDTYLSALNLPNNPTTRENEPYFYMLLILIQRTLNISIEKVISNFDLYYFMSQMSRYKSTYTNKTISTLRRVYEVVSNGNATDNDYKCCKIELYEIIDEYLNYYVRS